MNLFEYEQDLYEKGYNYIAGCDEAGRGPMAGPLVVAAVILPKDCDIIGLNDSKKLTSKKRFELFDLIYQKAIDVAIDIISPVDVDKLNVYQASKKGMITCIRQFKTPVDYILTDALPLNLDIPCLSIIKGDQKSASIAAASIIAKVTRDKIMIEYDALYPGYGFKCHKGYVTKEHKAALLKYGPTVIHRKSFYPVQAVITKQVSFDL